MTTLRLRLSLLMLIIATKATDANPKLHYHRYMLSDYKPQHSYKLQKDYKRLPRPNYPEEEVKARIGKYEDPMIEMIGNDTKVKLHDLLVRIYHNKTYICMGTLLTEQTIITAGTCFTDPKAHNYTIKTSTDQIIGLFERDEDVDPILDKDSVVTLLVLTKPVPKVNITTKLCLSRLRANMKVQLPTYIRSRRVVHNQITDVLPLAECRQKLNDPDGNIVTDSMICVRNEKTTTTCQHTNGSPLIYDGKICGINVLGHNCPSKFGVDLYASILNEAQFKNMSLSSIMQSNLEDDLI